MTQVSEVDRIKLFHQVAFIGNATLLSSLLKEGVNVNAEINNRTALHIASGQGHEECVELLVNNGAKIDVFDENGQTPLHWAVKNGHAHIVKLLLKYGASIDVDALHNTQYDVNISWETTGLIVIQNREYEIENCTDQTSIARVNIHKHPQTKGLYYEVTLVTGSAVRVGWITTESSLSNNDKGIELDNNAYYFDGHRAKKCHAQYRISYGRHWKNGDVVGCYIDLEKGTISFSLNGDDLGIAFENINSQHLFCPVLRLSPDHKVRVNFGQEPFKYNPSTYHSIFPFFCHFDSPLQIAACWGQIECAQLLLEHAPRLNELNWQGNSPLHLAAMNGQSEFIEFFMDKMNIEQRDVEGRTALHQAAYFGHSECVELLLDGGVSIDSLDIYGRTPLHYAVLQHHTECVQILIDRGANLFILDQNLRSILFQAVFLVDKKSHELVSLLIESGLEVDAQDKKSNTSLHYAAFCGNIDACRVLIEKGANNHHINDIGDTPLHSACRGGHLEVVQLLLDHGADVTVVNKSKSSPLHLATANGSHAIIDLLLKSPQIDINAKDCEGMTALHLASQFGFLDIVMTLLSMGADLNEHNHFHSTPLHLASANGCVEVVEVLLKEKADPNVSDRLGMTPLHLAVQEGHLSCVEELLKGGAFLNTKTTDGYTPLDLAVLSRQSEVTMRLIEIGAELNYKQSLLMWTKASIMTSHTTEFGGLIGTAVVPFRDSLYFVGGIDSQSPPFSSDVYVIQSVENKERKNESSHSFFHCKRLSTSGERVVRFRHAAILWNREVFLFGGYMNHHEMADFRVLPVLDLITLEWSTRKTRGDIPPPMIDCSASLFDSKVYIFGGKGDNIYNTLFVLDLNTLYWNKIEPRVQFISSALTPSNSKHSILSKPLNDSSQCPELGDNNNHTIHSFEDQNTFSQQTSVEKCYEPCPRYEHSAFFLGKRLFILSGHSSDFSPPQIEIFNTENLMWQNPPLMPSDGKCFPKGNIVWATSIKSNRGLCIVNSEKTEIWTFEYDENKNQILWDYPKVIGQIPLSCSGYNGSMMDSNKIFIFGGRPIINFNCNTYVLILEEKSCSLESDLRKIVNSKNFADIELIVANGDGTTTTFYAHKAILTAQSSYFDDLLKQLDSSSKSEDRNASSKNKQCIFIDDVRSNVVPLLLEFIYTDTVQIPPSLAVELTRAVKKYIPNRYTRLIRQIMRDVENDDNHFELLQKQIGTLLNNAKYSDVMFVLENGQKIFAHKVIVSARSDHFRALVMGGFGESNEQQITIRHIKPEIFSKIMDFLYARPVEIKEETAIDLLIAADLYRLPELLNICENLLIECEIDVENVLGMFQVADMYNAPRLKSYCLSYILRNFDACFKRDEFAQLHTDQQKEILNFRRKQEETTSMIRNQKDQRNNNFENLHRDHSDASLLSMHSDKHTVTKQSLIKESNSNSNIQQNVRNDSSDLNQHIHFSSETSLMDSVPFGLHPLLQKHSISEKSTLCTIPKYFTMETPTKKFRSQITSCTTTSTVTRKRDHLNTFNKQTFVIVVVATVFVFGVSTILWQRFFKRK